MRLRTTGRWRARASPLVNWCRICPEVGRSVAFGRNPSSGITRINTSAKTTNPAPPTMIGSRSQTSPSSVAAAIATNEVTCSICAPRMNTGATCSLPTSSVIQASTAPLVKVNPTPHKTWATMTAPKWGTLPSSTKPNPTSPSPMMIDSLRL